MFTNRLRAVFAVAGLSLIAACAKQGAPTEADAGQAPDAMTAKNAPAPVPMQPGERIPPTRKALPQPVPGELLIRFRSGTPSSQITNSVHKVSVTAVRSYTSVPRLRG